MCQSYSTQRIQRNSVRAMMAPVFDKPPTRPVKSVQDASAPALPSLSDKTVRTSLPEAKSTAIPQKQSLKKVASEDYNSVVWRIFSIDW